MAGTAPGGRSGKGPGVLDALGPDNLPGEASIIGAVGGCMGWAMETLALGADACCWNMPALECMGDVKVFLLLTFFLEAAEGLTLCLKTPAALSLRLREALGLLAAGLAIAAGPANAEAIDKR